MKAIPVILFSILSLNAFADEIVDLTGDMALTRCEYKNNTAVCSKPFSVGQPIQVTLTAAQGSALLFGQHQFVTTQDDYTFEGTISVAKIPSDVGFKYTLQVYVSSVKKGDIKTFVIKYLGSVTTTDMATLNTISWVGNVVSDGNISLTPDMLIGAPNADMSDF